MIRVIQDPHKPLIPANPVETETGDEMRRAECDPFAGHTASGWKPGTRRFRMEDRLRSGPTVHWCAVLAIFSLGCSGSGTLPELGEVTGEVTIDGRPLPGANIVFRPQNGGRPATALSDGEGKYELAYLIYPQLVKGTCTGENTVFISTYQGNTGPMRKIRPELVPDCYRGTTSDLKVHVDRGRNVINLKLRTDCDVGKQTSPDPDQPGPSPPQHDASTSPGTKAP